MSIYRHVEMSREKSRNIDKQLIPAEDKTFAGILCIFTPSPRGGPGWGFFSWGGSGWGFLLQLCTCCGVLLAILDDNDLSVLDELAISVVGILGSHLADACAVACIDSL